MLKNTGTDFNLNWLQIFLAAIFKKISIFNALSALELPSIQLGKEVELTRTTSCFFHCITDLKVFTDCFLRAILSFGSFSILSIGSF